MLYGPAVRHTVYKARHTVYSIFHFDIYISHNHVDYFLVTFIQWGCIKLIKGTVQILIILQKISISIFYLNILFILKYFNII